MSTEEQQADPTVKKLDELKIIETRRAQPLEEKHPFILNLFFGFMFPFICRCDPIINDDIPATMKKDETYYVMKKLSPRWRKMFESYQRDLQEQQIMGKRYQDSDKDAEFDYSIVFDFFVSVSYLDHHSAHPLLQPYSEK